MRNSGRFAPSIDAGSNVWSPSFKSPPSYANGIQIIIKIYIYMYLFFTLASNLFISPFRLGRFGNRENRNNCLIDSSIQTLINNKFSNLVNIRFHYSYTSSKVLLEIVPSEITISKGVKKRSNRLNIDQFGIGQTQCELAAGKLSSDRSALTQFKLRCTRGHKL